MRVTNRLIGLALGVGLAAVGVIAAVEVVLAWAGRSPWVVARADWDRSLAGLRWDDTPLTRVSAALLVVGALLCVGQLWPRRPTNFPLAGSGGSQQACIERRSAEERLRGVVLQDGEASTARVRVGRRRVRVVVGVPRGSPARTVKERLTLRVRGAMAAVGMARPSRVAVRVREDRRRRVR